MTSHEHSIVVAQPLDHVAGTLAGLAETCLFAPSIVRITMVAADSGQAADLTYEQLTTAATSVAPDSSDDLASNSLPAGGFAGSGVEGTLDYRLLAHDEGTNIVQSSTYEFTGADAVNVLTAATAAHNDQQFGTHLTTVAELIEAKATLPAGPGSDSESGPPALAR